VSASPRRPTASAAPSSSSIPGISRIAYKAAVRSAGLVTGSVRISSSLSTVLVPFVEPTAAGGVPCGWCSIARWSAAASVGRLKSFGTAAKSRSSNPPGTRSLSSKLLPRPFCSLIGLLLSLGWSFGGLELSAQLAPRPEQAHAGGGGSHARGGPVFGQALDRESTIPELTLAPSHASHWSGLCCGEKVALYASKAPQRLIWATERCPDEPFAQRKAAMPVIASPMTRAWTSAVPS
jgi:hypothetical protein